MAETLTPNYGWTKPDPGASANVWGVELNSDLDKIDAQMFIASTAGVPIGAMTLWAGISTTIPPNWLPCFGQSLDTTVYASLFNIFGYTYGGSGPNFNLPLMQQRFPIGTSDGGAVGATGGEVNHTLTVAELPPFTPPLFDFGHNHGLEQNPHVHPDPGHVHGINDFGHAHSFTNHALAGGVNVQPGSGFNVVATADATAVSGINSSIALAGTNIQAAFANIGINAAVANIALGSTGSGAAHNNMPPWITLIFIIKYA